MSKGSVWRRRLAELLVVRQVCIYRGTDGNVNGKSQQLAWDLNLYIQPDPELVITEEQKQEFYDAIEYDEDKAAVSTAIDFPKDVSQNYVCILVGLGLIKLLFRQ